LGGEFSAVEASELAYRPQGSVSYFLPFPLAPAWSGIDWVAPGTGGSGSNDVAAWSAWLAARTVGSNCVLVGAG